MIIFGPPNKVELPPEQIHFITGLTVNTINPYTFTPDSGFPNTAFAGAFFQIEIYGAVPVSGAYGFNVNDPAVSVSDTGIVKFDSEPSGSEIIITITPADGSAAFMYTCMPGLWFAQPKRRSTTWRMPKHIFCRQCRDSGPVRRKSFPGLTRWAPCMASGAKRRRIPEVCIRGASGAGRGRPPVQEDSWTWSQVRCTR